ncbi:MAG: NosD domain-containing protein [Bacteroidales bacterium]|nr:NosD domain-containing protein [Bacteroidales bacterium]
MKKIHLLNKYRIKPLAHRLVAVVALLFLVFSTSFADDVIVGGIITENQTWTPDNTYIVVLDLRVGQGVTLTILPGVTVKIDQGRGIQIWRGNLIVGDPQGINTDSVYFQGDYPGAREGWKWKGITIQGATEESSVIISHANIHDAEIGIGIVQSVGVLLQNSTISQNQNIGIQLMDCSYCTIQSCAVVDNYNGIEISATKSNSNSNNEIRSNRIMNINHNIYLLKESEGQLNENLISYNLIQDANNGIWMDNSGGGSSAYNVISNNYIVSNGSGFGFGILLAFDSTEVKNNIFWLNNMALTFDPLARKGNVSNNSYYQNVISIQLRDGCVDNSISRNTFSHQVTADFDTKEVAGVTFSNNNIFPDHFNSPLVINSTSGDLLVDQMFWGTDQQNLIDSLIWDHQDDPNTGNFFYIPYLTEPDTNLPISPPSGVKKQMINGQARISWNTNQESDLAGYYVYYGEFQYYHFEKSTDAGLVESLVVDNIYFNDSVAVTAYDGNGVSENAQLLGFESPFAFAEYFPYAGENSEICKNVSMFLLSNSTAPFSYEELIWKTSGDGTFNDETTLHPVYFPGEEDITLGNVVLSIHTLRKDRWFSDSLLLDIVDYVVVYAGNDTTIFNDEEILLSEASELNATVTNWESTGDGVFIADTILNAIYIPGEADRNTGYVTLILSGINSCSSHVDSIRLTIVSRFTIRGSVWQNGLPAHLCAVVAFEQSGSSAVSARSVVTTNVNGNFLFDDLIPSKYLLYAVPDTLSIANFYPGYYVNSAKWPQAYSLKLDADIYDVDIQLPALNYTLPQGNGSISGTYIFSILSPDDEPIYCQSWFSADSAISVCRNGQSNITVLLKNSSQEKVLQYTLTDPDGHFFFNNLPMGDYIIDAERAGYHTVVSPVISLTPDSPGESNVILSSNLKEVIIAINDDEGAYDLPEIYVYPNPASGFITVSVSTLKKGYYTLIVFDTFGRKMIKKNFDSPKSQQNFVLTLDLGNLSSGIYFGKITGGETPQKFSFIIR